MQQAISAGHQATLNTAKEILHAGGNAFDAAVAAHLTMFVSEPCMASAGGGGFALTYQAGQGLRFLDFFCQTPKEKRRLNELNFFPIEVDFGKDTEQFYVGAASVAVPGTMAGLFYLQENFGTMPFKRLAEIPIAQAKEGIALDAFQEIDFGLLAPILTLNPEGKELFTKEGTLKKKGDKIYLPFMPDFLSFLSEEGLAGFYQGEIGKQIAETNQSNGGHLTRADFEHYSVNEIEPLQFDYAQRKIYTANRPSLGGVLLGNFLGGLKTEGKNQVVKRLNQNLLDVNYQLAEFDRRENTNLADSWSTNTSTKGTSHFNILDRWGNAISLTTSIGEGNGTFIKGTHMQLNNMLGELFLLPNGAHSWQPNTRLNSMMSPTMVVDDNQALEMILGSGGASRIPFAIGQTLNASLEKGLDLKEAIQAPRMHFHENKLQAEFKEAFSAIPQSEYKTWDQLHMFFGGVHAIRIDGKQLEAGADPRRFGVAEIF